MEAAAIRPVKLSLTNPLKASHPPLRITTRLKRLKHTTATDQKKGIWTMTRLCHFSHVTPPPLKEVQLYADNDDSVGITVCCRLFDLVTGLSGDIHDTPRWSCFHSPAFQSLSKKKKEQGKHMAPPTVAAADRCVDWWWQRWLTRTLEPNRTLKHDPVSTRRALHMGERSKRCAARILLQLISLYKAYVTMWVPALDLSEGDARTLRKCKFKLIKSLVGINSVGCFVRRHRVFC